MYVWVFDCSDAEHAMEDIARNKGQQLLASDWFDFCIRNRSLLSVSQSDDLEAWKEQNDHWLTAFNKHAVHLDTPHGSKRRHLSFEGFKAALSDLLKQ